MCQLCIQPKRKDKPSKNIQSHIFETDFESDMSLIKNNKSCVHITAEHFERNITKTSSCTSFLSGSMKSQYSQHFPLYLLSGVRLRTCNLLAALHLPSPAHPPHCTNLYPSPLWGHKCQCPWSWHSNSTVLKLLKGNFLIYIYIFLQTAGFAF